MNDILMGERFVWDSENARMTKTVCRINEQSTGVNNRRFRFVDVNDYNKHWHVIESRLGKASENHHSVFFLGEGHDEEAFAAFRLLYSVKRKAYREGLDKMRVEINKLERVREINRRRNYD